MTIGNVPENLLFLYSDQESNIIACRVSIAGIWATEDRMVCGHLCQVDYNSIAFVGKKSPWHYQNRSRRHCANRERSAQGE